MKHEATRLPDDVIGFSATGGPDFDALGVATVLSGIAAPVAAIGRPSQSRAAENPIATVDNNPAPRANEV